MKKIIYTFLTVALISVGVVTAKDLIATDHSHSITSSTVDHSGRTNSAGCHNDNKNGGYHCH